MFEGGVNTHWDKFDEDASPRGNELDNSKLYFIGKNGKGYETKELRDEADKKFEEEEKTEKSL